MNSNDKAKNLEKLRGWILSHSREWEILIGAQKGTWEDYERLAGELARNNFEELQELLLWKIIDFLYKSEKWYKRAFWKISDWLWYMRKSRKKDNFIGEMNGLI